MRKKVDYLYDCFLPDEKIIYRKAREFIYEKKKSQEVKFDKKQMLN
jgi:hypothetical protein